MTKHRSDLTKGSPLPSTWVNSLMEFMGAMASPNLAVTKAAATTVQIVAGTGNDQVAVAINGRWRYNTATVGPVSVPGTGAKATFDAFVTAADNDFTAADPADSTNYGFGLAVLAQGNTPGTALYRRVATVEWDGVQVARINSLLGVYDGRMIGEVRFMALNATPPLWLPCNGAPVSRTTYAVLHAAIKDGPGGPNTYPYGAGDGSTTFAVPDLSGRVPVGPGTAAGGGVEGSPPARVVGTKWGVNAVVLARTHMPAHDHGGGNHLHGPNGNNLDFVGNSGYPSGFELAAIGGTNQGVFWGGTTGYSGNVIGVVGGGTLNGDNPTAHDNTPPSIAIPAYIYAGV